MLRACGLQKSDGMQNNCLVVQCGKQSEPCPGHVDVQAAVAEVEGLELTDMELATALALSAESSQQLKTAIQDGADDGALVRRAVQEHKERKSRQDNMASDASPLDFGLFSRFPSLEQLLLQTRPVVWLTQLALWPELVSKFLQLIRCSPMLLVHFKRDLGAFFRT